MSFNPGRGVTANQVLTWDGTKYVWTTPLKVDLTVKTITTTYAALITDQYIRCNHTLSFTLTLPLDPPDGFTYTIKDVSSVGASAQNITIVPSGGGTIEGSSSFPIRDDRGSYSITHVGSNVWDVY